ncbi:MAG: hypothetical protein AB7O28_12855 [Vicinamibacterales bacterium]
MTALTRLAIRSVLPATVLALCGVATSASAQTIGTFPFALQPFCNQVTITITQEGSTYRLAGWDDACGAVQRYPLHGTIAPNLDGTLHITFTVTRPTGISVETSVRNFNVGTLSGNWTDSAGNSGVFPLAGAPGGSGARPAPTSSIPANSITTVNIVDGSVSAADVNPSQVQLRVSGSCASGQAVRSVNQDGTVVCGAVTGPTTMGSEVSVLNGIDSNCEELDALTFGTVPAGTLSCTAAVTANFSHTSDTVDHLEFDVATSTNACNGLNRSVYEMPAGVAAEAGIDVTVPVHRWLGSVSAGPLTVYLNARTLGTSANVFASQFTCTFTPQ